jgi:hypothetical protein
VREWDSATEIEIAHTKDKSGMVSSVAFSQDATRIVLGSQDIGGIVHSATGTEIAHVDG